MSPLAAQQRALVAALWGRPPADPRAGPSNEPGVKLRREPPASTAARLDSYRRSVWARLVGSLQRDFPRVQAVIGEAAFRKLAVAYLGVHPPSTAALRDLGRHFPAFVANRSAELGGDAALAVDLARLEWAWVEVFDAADRAPVRTEALARVPPSAWPGLRFELSPALRIEPFDFRVDRFELDAPHARPPATPTELLIWRRAHRVFVRPLDRREATALAIARSGAAFATLCEAAVEPDEPVDTAAADVVGLLRRWLDDDLVVGLFEPQSSERGALEERTETQTEEEKR